MRRFDQAQGTVPAKIVCRAYGYAAFSMLAAIPIWKKEGDYGVTPRNFLT